MVRQARQAVLQGVPVRVFNDLREMIAAIAQLTRRRVRGFANVNDVSTIEWDANAGRFPHVLEQ